MTVSCERCGTANRASAKFCAGCAAMLPGFVPTGPSELQASRANGRQAPVSREDAGESEAKQTLRLLVYASLLMVGAFMTWYLHVVRTAKPVSPPPAASEVVLAPGFQQLAPLEPDLRRLPAVSDATRAAAERSALALPGRSPKPVSTTWQQPLRDPLATVGHFYRALSHGDGATAAALVTASKRAKGPLSAQAMSSFYQSLREPLAVRSVRQLDERVIEARYTYRATRTACEGRALVTMESSDQGAAILSIAANC